MRFRIAALMLLFVLPVMYPFAAPAPERPYAILDIGPPPKGKTAEQHCKEQIALLTGPGPGRLSYNAFGDPEVKKLRLFKSVKQTVKGKEIFPWLEKTMRVTPGKDERRLRVTFLAGTHAEQATVINALLRIYVQIYVTQSIKWMEATLRRCEETAAEDAKVIEEEKDVKTRMKYLMQRDETKLRNEGFRAEIVRLKQVTVKWAK